MYLQSSIDTRASFLYGGVSCIFYLEEEEIVFYFNIQNSAATKLQRLENTKEQ